MIRQFSDSLLAAGLLIVASLTFYATQKQPGALSAQTTTVTNEALDSAADIALDESDMQLVPTREEYETELVQSRMAGGDCYSIPWFTLFDVRGVNVTEPEGQEPTARPKMFISAAGIDVNGDGMQDRLFSQTGNSSAQWPPLTNRGDGVRPYPTTLYLADGEGYVAAPICEDAYDPQWVTNCHLTDPLCDREDFQYWNWDFDAYYWYINNDPDPMPCIDNPSGGRYVQKDVSNDLFEFFMPEITDVNGDGLQDLVQTLRGPDINYFVSGPIPLDGIVYINTGQGFKAAPVCP